MKSIIDWPVCYKQERSEHAQVSINLFLSLSPPAWVSVDILDQMMSQSCLYRLLDTHSVTLQCLASGCYNTIRIIGKF